MKEQCNFFEIKVEKLRDYTSKISCDGFLRCDTKFVLEYSPNNLKVISGNILEDEEKALKYVLTDIFDYFNSDTHQKFNGKSIFMELDLVTPENSTYELH